MEYWLYIFFILCHKNKLNIGFGIVHTFERNNMSRDSNWREELEGKCYLLRCMVLLIEYQFPICPTEIKHTFNEDMFQDSIAEF